MKKLVFILALSCAIASLHAYVRPQIETDPAKVAELERNMGGRVYPPSNGNKIMIWDATGKCEKPIAQFFHYNSTVLHLPCETASEPFNGNAFVAAKGKISSQHPCVVLLFEDKESPTLVIYPEDAVATINIYHLKIKNDKIFTSRVSKELFRAIGLVMGGYSMPRTPCVLEPVFSVFDLDAMKISTLAPMRFNGIFKTAKLLDLSVARPVPYRIACQQGWAPAPTNEIQQAIWDEVRKLPERPIKIEFDPTKGR